MKQAFGSAVTNKRGIFSPPCLSLEPEKPNCRIKGNIDRGSGKKTYHLPECQEYSVVMVEKDLGEQWFCTEKEATQVGFTKATHCP